MPRGQYDRSKSKEQRAAEKKAAGKGAKLAAPAVTPPAPKPSKSFSSRLASGKPSKEAAIETAVQSIEKAFHVKMPDMKDVSAGFASRDPYSLVTEINNVSAILTTLSSNRALLSETVYDTKAALESAIAETVDHLSRLRALLPHGLPVVVVAKAITKDDLEAAEQARIDAEVEKRRSLKSEQTPIAPAYLAPKPVPMPGTTIQPPAFLPLAAPPTNIS